MEIFKPFSWLVERGVYLDYSCFLVAYGDQPPWVLAGTEMELENVINTREYGKNQPYPVGGGGRSVGCNPYLPARILEYAVKYGNPLLRLASHGLCNIVQGNSSRYV